MKKTQAVSAGIAFVLAITLTLHAQTAFSVRTVSTPTAVQSASADSVLAVVAEEQGLQLVPPAEVPPCGTFWTVSPGPGGGVGPPFPCPPLDPSLPIYAIVDGQFLVDGTIGSQASLNTPRAGRLAASSTSAAALGAQAEAVVNLITQVQTAAANRQMQTLARAMGMDVPSSGGDGSGDGGAGSLPMFSSIFRINTNAMWLEITNVSGGVAYLNLHNATNQVYAITSKTNLALAGWNIEQEVWPTNPAVMPFAVPVLDRTSMLFIRAQDWTGVTENGNTTPEWWFWKYFGMVGLSDTNLDSGGNTLVFDYEEGLIPDGLAPNVISFTWSYTNYNQYVSTSIEAQVNVTGGMPSFFAVVLDSTNFAGATWNAYTSSNIIINLGTTQGWHDVWIGLRGWLPRAEQTWQHKHFFFPDDPDVISFTWSYTNQSQYVSTPVKAQVNVTGGMPFFFTVVLDSTNITGATWNAYTSSNIIINLGTTQGWHNVWIVLRGWQSNAPQTWQLKHLNLALPPVLAITNPVANVVSQPIIQISGFCQEPLASISYDISNAVGVATNQPSEITDRYYDTNVWGFTTNYFECLDVPLVTGLNIITIHATDLAGNTTATNFNFTLDYSSKTNPPLVQITWPQTGAQLSGSNFTVTGWVADPTVTITTQLVLTNGSGTNAYVYTNMYAGAADRSGNFWLGNLPISAGTNAFPITVKDVAGNTSVTNISVIQSALVLTINPVTPDSQLWQPTVNLTGTISDTTYAVWVNGVKGHNNGNGTWSANNVPVNNGGTASFAATAYAPNEQQPDGSYGN